MAYIPVTNVAELLIQATIDSLTVDNVLNFLYPSTIDTTDLADLTAAGITSWVANLAAALSEDVILQAMKATDLTTVSSPTFTDFAPAATNGDVASDTPPTNAALVITSTTAQRGRSFRGRTYVGGFPRVEMLNAGAITSTYAADLLAAFSEFIDDIESATGTDFVIVSRYTNNNPRASGLATPVTGLFVEQNIDSQRRRLAGRGI